jgi:hypothetical protein
MTRPPEPASMVRTIPVPERATRAKRAHDGKGATWLRE